MARKIHHITSFPYCGWQLPAPCRCKRTVEVRHSPRSASAVPCWTQTALAFFSGSDVYFVRSSPLCRTQNNPDKGDTRTRRIAWTSLLGPNIAHAHCKTKRTGHRGPQRRAVGFRLKGVSTGSRGEGSRDVARVGNSSSSCPRSFEERPPDQHILRQGVITTADSHRMSVRCRGAFAAASLVIVSRGHSIPLWLIGSLDAHQWCQSRVWQRAGYVQALSH